MRTSIFKDFPTGYPDPNIVLGYGELFIELPPSKSENIRVKYGDGVTPYKDLPYRLGDTSTDELYFTESQETTINNALAKVVNGSDVRTVVANLKKAIELTASGSGQIVDIGKELVDTDTETRTFETVEEALESLTEKEPLSIVLGTLAQAIEITFKQSPGGHIDIAVEKLSKLTEDTSETVEEALNKVTAGEELNIVIGALKNAISLVEKEIPIIPEPIDVANTPIEYEESKATNVAEALTDADSGQKLNSIIAGLKKAIELVQVGGGENIDVTRSKIEYVPSSAETKDEALDQVGDATELGILIGALKRAIELTDDNTDFGEETLPLGAARRKLNASLRDIVDNINRSGVYDVFDRKQYTDTFLPNSYYIGKSEEDDSNTPLVPSNNNIGSEVDIAYKELFFNENNAKTQKEALDSITSGSSLADIVSGLKKAIELVDHEIDISNMKIEYVDDMSTSVESVKINSKSGQKLKNIIASLKRTIMLLDKKIEDNAKASKAIGDCRVSFKNNTTHKDPVKLMDDIVTGSEMSLIVSNLKNAIILLNKKIPVERDINKETLVLKEAKMSSVSTALKGIKSGTDVASAVSALKQAVLLLDKNKFEGDINISDKEVIFNNNLSKTRNQALQSVISGNSVSGNIAALKRAIELTDSTDDISNKRVRFVEDKSENVEVALKKINSKAGLNIDIAALKRAVELVNSEAVKDIDISSKEIKWNINITGSTLDAISNIKSGAQINMIIPYIKKALSDYSDRIAIIERNQAQIKKVLEDIQNELKNK